MTLLELIKNSTHGFYNLMMVVGMVLVIFGFSQGLFGVLVSLAGMVISLLGFLFLFEMQQVSEEILKNQSYHQNIQSKQMKVVEDLYKMFIDINKLISMYIEKDSRNGKIEKKIEKKSKNFVDYFLNNEIFLTKSIADKIKKLYIHNITVKYFKDSEYEIQKTKLEALLTTQEELKNDFRILLKVE